MSYGWWFVVILLTAAVSMLGTAWFLGRDNELTDQPCDHEYTPNEAGTYEWCQKCDSVRPVLPRAGYLPGPPFAGAQDAAYQAPAPVPWDLAGAAYVLGQVRADQDAVSREVNAIFTEIEGNPERWRHG